MDGFLLFRVPFIRASKLLNHSPKQRKPLNKMTNTTIETVDALIASRLKKRHTIDDFRCRRFTGRHFANPFKPTTMDAIVDTLGRRKKLRKKVSRLVLLGKRIQKFNPEDLNGILWEFRFACTDSSLSSSFTETEFRSTECKDEAATNTRLLSRLLHDAVAIGMLKCTDNNSKHGSRGYGRGYIFNRSVMPLLQLLEAAMETTIGEITGCPEDDLEDDQLLSTNRSNSEDDELDQLLSTITLNIPGDQFLEQLCRGESADKLLSTYRPNEVLKVLSTITLKSDPAKVLSTIGAEGGREGGEREGETHYIGFEKLMKDIRESVNGFQGSSKGSHEFAPRSIESCPRFRFSGNSNNRLKEDSDEVVMKGIHEAYPFLKEYMEDKLEWLNNGQQPMFRLSYRVNIHRSRGEASKGCITKIGGRLYCPFCSTPKGELRRDFLKSVLGWQEVYNHDVRSSIYRVTYLMNYGKWLDEDWDLYDIMKPQDCHLCPGDPKGERDMFKLLCNMLYFTKSPEDCFNHMFPSWERDRMEDSVKEAVKSRLHSYASSMERVIGPSYGREIFIHESNIYMNVLGVLRHLGCNVHPVFDCFYTDSQKTLKACVNILPLVAAEYFRECNYRPLEKQIMHTEESLERVVREQGSSRVSGEGNPDRENSPEVFHSTSDEELESNLESVMKYGQNPLEVAHRMEMEEKARERAKARVETPEAPYEATVEVSSQSTMEKGL